MSSTTIALYENLKQLNESQFGELCLRLEAYGYDLTFITRQGVPIATSAQELIDLVKQKQGLNHLQEVLEKVIQGKTTSVETPENQIDKKPLIALLLECPSLRDIDTRRSLLKMLPHHIVDHIKVGNTIKEAVINLVEVCMNYSEGLKHLFEAVRFFDEKTVPFQRLSHFLDVQAFLPDISPPEVLAKVETPLTKLMAQLHLSSQVRASDEFTQHNDNSLHLIREAMVQLKQLSPQTPDYSRVSLIVGSVLSSTGELLQAERLFTQVLENTNKNAEKALAHFNLFQIQLRRKIYPEALDNLQTAIKINPHYALHDLHKYPFERLLGAGGMGCVFLCRNQNPLIRYTRVVVKCFWGHPKGTLKEVFKEPFAMHNIAGEYIPEPLDFGYVDLIKQERAYFVTAYIDDAIDGEAWLEKDGPMDLKTGLQVGLQIAKGLQIAHDAGICHLDLKPANILLKQTDNEIAVRIIDFGLSQVVPSLQQKAMTLQKNRAGLSQFGQAIFGTLDYACPEQQGFTQYGKPGVQCDVFAFGMTMYRFLTGKNPRYFRERDLPKVEALRDLLGDCVEQEPNQRPESAQLLVSHLIEQKQQLETERKEDENAWQVAEPKNTKFAYQTYLDGKTLKQYADEAKQPLQSIESEIQAKLLRAVIEQLTEIAKQKQLAEKDEKAWQIACQKNTTYAYQTYLDGNTLKQYADDARKQLQTIVEKGKIVEKNKAAWKKASQDQGVRYTDNGDGTITDNRTGLIWLKNANCFNRQNWKTAMQSAANLADGQCELSDGSKQGDWRLPTKEEWKEMMDTKYVDRENYSQPALSNAAGTGPWKEGDAFSGVQSGYYWSSTPFAKGTAWYVYFGSGDVGSDHKTNTGYVWPLRGRHLII